MSAFYFQDEHAPKPNRPNHIGVNAIIVHNDCIMLEKRSDCDQWGLIGGGVKLTETLEQALTREIYEETQISINDFEFFKIYSDPTRIVSHPDGNILRIISVVYIAALKAKILPVLSDESSQIEYFSRANIENLSIVPTHTEIIKDYYSI